MKPISLLLLCISSILPLSAQHTHIARAGLIKAFTTISPAYSIVDRSSYFYGHGSLEGFVEARISIAGEAYLALGSIGSRGDRADIGHSLFSGINLHYIRANHDLYIGIQPGIATKRISTNALDAGHTMTYIPVASAVVGYNYYIHRFFHFFVQGRWVLGQYNTGENKSLNELRLSAGLGFNINTRR